MNKAIQLSVEEKMRLLAGKDGWHVEDCDGKLYSVSVADGPTGVRRTGVDTWDENSFKVKDLPAVAYPSLEVLSQSWDKDLAYKMGQCLADDCIEKDVDVLLAPGVNMKRSPMCGRNFEYFSEDPYVAGTLAGEYIKGIQDNHVGATLKHYLCNNNEIGRHWSSSNVDERTLRELYMRAFEIALRAKPWAVMSSYNLLNGVRVSHNAEYMKILREELGHEDRLIMSDWSAVRDHIVSIKAGTDLEMPFNEEHLNDLREGYAKGEITEAELDVCVERVLKFIEKVEVESKQRKIRYTTEERRAVAQKIEEEGIVLLKNNGVLPLSDGQSVALASTELNKYYAGGGSARVVPEQEVKPLAECLTQLMPGSTVVASDVLNEWSEAYHATFANVDGKDAAIVVCGAPSKEGNDRATLKLQHDFDEEMLIKAIAKRNPNTVVVMYSGGVVDMSSWIDDVAAVIYVGFAGQRGPEAIANVLTGAVNPGGKLTETFAKTRKDYPSENIPFDGLNYDYAEKMDLGYRYFDKHPEKVRFPFGYGLSYTSFGYSNMEVSCDGERCSVSFELTNTGDRDGVEVSQMYVRAIDSAVEKPLKELRGFARTELRAGERKKVCVELDDRAFYHYDVECHAWVKDGGKYEIIVAENAASPCLCATVVI